MPLTPNAAPQTVTAETTTSASGGAAPVAVLPGTRIDPAHTIADASPSWAIRQSAGVGQPAPEGRIDGGLIDGAAQVEAQAAQLAALLEARQQELDQREAQLERREADFSQEVREARFRLSQQRRQIGQRQTARQRVLRRQSERLDRRRAVLEASRRQAAQMRQEALELRLTTEQLHAELVGSADPTALAPSLDRLRQRLTDHHRGEIQELTRRQAELELLKAELAEQYEKLRREVAERGDHNTNDAP